MKTTTTTTLISGILSALAAVCLLWLSSGCTSTPKIGGGKLEPVTKTAVGLAAAGAKIAAPDYAGAIDAAKDRIVNMGEPEAAAKAPGQYTQAEIDAIMKAAGYGYAYTVFMDGVVIDDFSRFSYRKQYVQTGTGANIDPVSMVLGAQVEAAGSDAEEDVDARLDAALERLAEKKKAK